MKGGALGHQHPSGCSDRQNPLSALRRTEPAHSSIGVDGKQETQSSSRTSCSPRSFRGVGGTEVLRQRSRTLAEPSGPSAGSASYRLGSSYARAGFTSCLRGRRLFRKSFLSSLWFSVSEPQKVPVLGFSAKNLNSTFLEVVKY